MAAAAASRSRCRAGASTWAGSSARRRTSSRVWLYAASISTPTRGLPGRGYVWVLVLRLVLVAGLVVVTWREAWRPDLDPVRNPDPDAISWPSRTG